MFATLWATSMKLPGSIGRVSIAFLAAAMGCACSLLFDVSAAQCTTDADCAKRGPQFASARCVQSACAEGVDGGKMADAGNDAAEAGPIDRRYACLGNNPAPAAAGPSTAYQVTLTDLLTGTGVPNLRVKICPNLTDPICTSPTSIAMTDALGVAHLTVDTSRSAFGSYVDVEPLSPDGGTPDLDGGDSKVYVPGRIYYTSVPIADDRSDDYQMVTFGALQSFASLFSATADFSQGFAFLIAQDCASADSADVSFFVDQKSALTQTFYLETGQPSTTASMTDPSGIGGFVNLPSGARTFTSKLADGGRPIGSLTGYVRRATVLYAKVAPAFNP